MKRCAIYLRVSTQEQAQKGYSLEAQEEKLLAYAKLHDYKVVGIYKDAGVSGAKLDRPAINRLRNDIKDIDVVVVYKLDRLARSIKDTMILIEDVFEANKVDFVSLTENLDTSTPVGRATIGIMASIAQLERDTIRERMMTGQIQSVKNGNYIFAAPIGYIRKGKKLYIDEKLKPIVEFIIEQLLLDLSTAQVADMTLKKFGYFGYSEKFLANRIQDMFKKRVYCGHTVLIGNEIKNTHEAYLTEEQYEIIRKKLSKRSGVRSLNSNPKDKLILLRGLIKCQTCNKRLSARYYSHNNHVYLCKYCYNFNNKSAHSIRESKIIDSMLELIKTPEFKINKPVETKEEKIIDYGKELNELAIKSEKIKTAWFNGLLDDDDFKKFSKEIEEKRIYLTEKQKDKDTINNINKRKDEIKEILVDFETVFNKIDYETKRQLLIELIDYIEVDITPTNAKRLGNDVSVKNIVFNYT